MKILVFLATFAISLGLAQCTGEILWQDEFNGSYNLSNWDFDLGSLYGGWGNNESEYYTNRNAYFSNGQLHIVAKKENSYDSTAPPYNFQYTSARLISKRTFKYGIFEVRAKLPKGLGTWPAIWLLSAWPKYIWPDDGEIDIMEAVGQEPGNIYGSIHCKKYNHKQAQQKSISYKIANPYDDFHIFKIDWNQQRIKFSVDGVEYFVYNNEGTYDAWPFDNDFKILLNLAIGGWGGQKGIDDSIFPVEFVIDYVRQYKN